MRQPDIFERLRVRFNSQCRGLSGPKEFYVSADELRELKREAKRWAVPLERDLETGNLCFKGVPMVVRP